MTEPYRYETRYNVTSKKLHILEGISHVKLLCNCMKVYNYGLSGGFLTFKEFTKEVSSCKRCLKILERRNLK
jgi:hypothetical protein